MESRQEFSPNYEPTKSSAPRFPFIGRELPKFLTGRAPIQGIWGDKAKLERRRAKNEEVIQNTRLAWKKEAELLPTEASSAQPPVAQPAGHGLSRFTADSECARLAARLETLHELDEDAYRASVRRIADHLRASQAYENETPQYVALVVHHMRASVWHLLESPKADAPRQAPADAGNPFDDASIPHGNDPSTRTSGPQTSRYLRKRAA